MCNLKQMPDGSYINADAVIVVSVDEEGNNCVNVGMSGGSTYSIYTDAVLDFEDNPDGKLEVDALLERVVQALKA